MRYISEGGLVQITQAFTNTISSEKETKTSPEAKSDVLKKPASLSKPSKPHSSPFSFCSTLITIIWISRQIGRAPGCPRNAVRKLDYHKTGTSARVDWESHIAPEIVAKPLLFISGGFVGKDFICRNYTAWANLCCICCQVFVG